MKLSSAVAAAIILIGLAACGGGDDEGTTRARGADAGASEGSLPNLPGRLEDALLRLHQHGFEVRATSLHPSQTPRSLWPDGGLRVETGEGPLTIRVYRSEEVVKQLLRADFISFGRDGVAQLGGCGKYVYFVHNAINDEALGRVLRIADLCRGEKTEFIVVE